MLNDMKKEIFEKRISLKLLKSRVIDYSKPVFGICCDWRIQKEDPSENNSTLKGEKYYYFNPFFTFQKILQELDCELLPLSFEDRYIDYGDKISGYIIPGGRDIDPSLYNQKSKSKSFDKESFKKRYDHICDFLKNSDSSIPILGTCLGFQFLNVYFGGSLNQEIRNLEAHQVKN